MSSEGYSSPQSDEPFQPPSAEELSSMLPQFTLSHLIAVGGMGAVYAGIQRALDRPIALKILPPDAARNSSAIDRFRTEAKAMARLTHQHIPTVYDFDVQGGYCYLVMEYVDGWNVHQLITKGELTPPKAINLIGQVCDALAYAHERGVMHGDIKPSNLLVNQQGVLKLADFGLAQLLEHTGTQKDDWSPMGTPEYAAPELWDPNAVLDQRSDLYSLGVVFYEMLTGTAPQGEFELPAKALKLDPRVDAIIAGCMQPDPARRYQTAAEVKQMLDAIGQKPAASPKNAPVVRIIRPGPTRKGQRPRSRAPKKMDIMPLVWILLVIIVITAVVIVLRNPPAAPVTELSPSQVPVSSKPR